MCVGDVERQRISRSFRREDGTVGVFEHGFYRKRSVAVGKCDLDRTVLIVTGWQCFQKIVADAFFRAGQQINVTENSTHPEFVLILEIAAVAPFDDEHSERVFSVAYHSGDIKFTCGVRYLAVADKAAVQPYIKAGVDTFEIQVCTRRSRIFFIIKAMYISTARVDHRDIRRIHRERIAVVCILVQVTAVVLPHARHRNILKTGRIIAFPVKFILQVIDIFIISEFPCPGEQQKAIRCLTLLRKQLPRCRSGDIISTVRERIFVKYAKVFKVIWNDHNFLL